MAIFNFRKREEPTEEITPPVDDVLLRALMSGETITREKALTLPAVSGAVDFICNCVACMPVKLYKYKQGKVTEVEDDPRTKMLNGDTGDTLDGFQMKKAMVEDYLLGKGGYAYIRRFRNEVTGLFYVEEKYITIMKTYEPIHKTYEILVEGKNYKPYEFIKLLRNTKDGASGIGLTSEVSKALETAYQTLLYQLSLVKSGGNKKGFLKAQRKLGQEEIDILKRAWKNLYANNEENVVVLNNGLEFQEASNSSVEMQLNESKHTLQEEINNLFHISNYFDLTFKEAIYPIIKAFETALNRDLLLEKEKKNYYFEFDVKEIVKANLTERYSAYKVAKETGFMTLNEIRRAENMNYVEGLDVVNVGLGAVLYDVNTGQYYTPNTGQTQQSGEQLVQMLENHELAEAYDESGNSAERAVEQRFNDVHDPKTGRFGTKSGTGGVALLDSEFVGSGSIDDPSNINKVVDGQIKMTYVRVPNQNTANYGDTYGQNIEPKGEYMSMDIMQGNNRIQGYEYGTITFKKPLIVEYKNTSATGWKKDVSEMYGGKTGKALSNALIKDGFDAIITVDGGWTSEIVNLAGEKKPLEKRFNDVHDPKTGRFGEKHGSGTDAKIAELEQQLSEAKGLLAKASIKNQIEMLKEGFEGTQQEWLAKKQAERERLADESRKRIEAEKKAKQEKEEAQRQQLEDELRTQPKDKVEQYKIIQETNPMNDDYHTGIRKPSDIKTWEEVVADKGDDQFNWGDFSREDAVKALNTGKITIYSSYPIKDGVFVSTSKAQSQEYAGGAGNKVYSKTVPLKDVAWINGDEGQFAKIKG